MPSWYWMKRNQETKMKEKIFRVKYSDDIEEIEMDAESVEECLLSELGRFSASDIKVEEIHEGLPVEGGRKVLLTIENSARKTEIYDDKIITVEGKNGASSGMGDFKTKEDLEKWFKD